MSPPADFTLPHEASHTNRWAIPNALAHVVTTIAPRAGAGQQQAPPAYSELPSGRLTSPPNFREARVPTSIPASESVPGLRVFPQSSGSGMFIASDTAKVPFTGMLTPQMQTLENVPGCFSQIVVPQPGALAASPSLDPFGRALQEGRGVEWEHGQSPQAAIWNTQQGHQIFAVHSEQVVEQNGNMTLESTDAWFDAGSRGFRLITKASLGLRQVATVPGNIRIFAGRDDRPDKHFVQFVIVRPKDTPMQQVSSAFATRSDGVTVHTGACGHHRLALLANNSGETAVFQFTTILPDLPPNTRSAAIPPPPPPPEVGACGGRTRDLRVRAFRAMFSVSQTSRDKEPVVSVATAWAGAETFHRIFLTPPTGVAGVLAMPPPPSFPQSPPPGFRGKPFPFKK
jgi:hypothetical protein